MPLSRGGKVVVAVSDFSILSLPLSYYYLLGPPSQQERLSPTFRIEVGGFLALSKACGMANEDFRTSARGVDRRLVRREIPLQEVGGPPGCDASSY